MRHQIHARFERARNRIPGIRYSITGTAIAAVALQHCCCSADVVVLQARAGMYGHFYVSVFFSIKKLKKKCPFCFVFFAEICSSPCFAVGSCSAAHRRTPKICTYRKNCRRFCIFYTREAIHQEPNTRSTRSCCFIDKPTLALLCREGGLRSVQPLCVSASMAVAATATVGGRGAPIERSVAAWKMQALSRRRGGRNEIATNNRHDGGGGGGGDAFRTAQKPTPSGLCVVVDDDPPAITTNQGGGRARRARRARRGSSRSSSSSTGVMQQKQRLEQQQQQPTTQCDPSATALVVVVVGAGGDIKIEVRVQRYMYPRRVSDRGFCTSVLLHIDSTTSYVSAYRVFYY